MRRCWVLLDRLVIVESPNKCAKITAILSGAVTDWSFGQPGLKAVGSAGREAVAVKPTTGHFMHTDDVVIAASALAPPPSAAAAAALPDAAADEAGTGAKGGKKKKAKGGKKAKVAVNLDLPPLPDGAPLLSFTPHMSVSPDNHSIGEIVTFLQANKGRITEIILASDPDREGELIAVHTLRYLKRRLGLGKKGDGVTFSRAYIHSITEEGVIDAMRQRKPHYCNFALAEAASARHTMDRLLGWVGSTALRAVHKDLQSMGRVQTPALILVMDLERRIEKLKADHKAAFVVQGRFAMREAAVADDAAPLFSRQVTFQIQHADGADGTATTAKGPNNSSNDTAAAAGSNQFASKEEAERWLQTFMHTSSDTKSAEDKKAAAAPKLDMCIVKPPAVTSAKQKPPPPHIMQSVLTAANSALKASSEEVTQCLQELFQAGLITYPRTDSTRIDPVFVEQSIRPHIEKTFGKAAFKNWQEKSSASPSKDEDGIKKADSDASTPDKKDDKKKKKKDAKADDNIEDAHEALRPTSLKNDPSLPTVVELFGIPAPSASAPAASSPMNAFMGATGSYAPRRTGLAGCKHALAVYKLIYTASIAAFMVEKESETCAVSVGVSVAGSPGTSLVARLSASRVTAPGWSQAKSGVAEEAAQDGEDGATEDATASASTFELLQRLPETIQGAKGTGKGAAAAMAVSVSELKIAEKPLVLPKLYTEGTLIQELKNHGVGRPSTYNTILKTLFSRKYIFADSQQRLHTTPTGRGVATAAQNVFPAMVDIGFTASFERELDAIATFRTDEDDATTKKGAAQPKESPAGDPSNPDLGEGNNPLSSYTLSRLLFSLQSMVESALLRHQLLGALRNATMRLAVARVNAKLKGEALPDEAEEQRSARAAFEPTRKALLASAKRLDVAGILSQVEGGTFEKRVFVPATPLQKAAATPGTPRSAAGAVKIEKPTDLTLNMLADEVRRLMGRGGDLYTLQWSPEELQKFVPAAEDRELILTAVATSGPTPAAAQAPAAPVATTTPAANTLAPATPAAAAPASPPAKASKSKKKKQSAADKSTAAPASTPPLATAKPAPSTAPTPPQSTTASAPLRSPAAPASPTVPSPQPIRTPVSAATATPVSTPAHTPVSAATAPKPATPVKTATPASTPAAAAAPATAAPGRAPQPSGGPTGPKTEPPKNFNPFQSQEWKFFR